MNATACLWLLQQQEPPTGLIAGLFLVFLLIFAAVYAFFAICLMKIAQKTGTENAWWAWVPILNMLLMLNIARKPLWWIILFFVPLVNFVIIILVCLGIAQARGKSAIWGILMIILPIIAYPYLAFSE